MPGLNARPACQAEGSWRTIKAGSTGARCPARPDAGALRAKYSQVREQLRNNPYHRPIYIESAEAGDRLGKLISNAVGSTHVVREHFEVTFFDLEVSDDEHPS